MTKIIKAKTHQQVYDFRAKFLTNDSFLSGRGQFETEFTMSKIIRKLNSKIKFNKKRVLLDIGPGNGTLLKMVSPMLKKCYGVDPSSHGLQRLRKNCKNCKNVYFKKASSSKLPFTNDCFNFIVINGVVSLLDNKNEVNKTIKEISRVTKFGGAIFIGEVPCVFENNKQNSKQGALGKKSLLFLISKIIFNFIKPEPTIISPNKHLFYNPDKFLNLCRKYSLTGKYLKHITTRGESNTRYDYLLWKT